MPDALLYLLSHIIIRVFPDAAAAYRSPRRRAARPFSPSLPLSFTHSLTHSLTHSFTHSLFLRFLSVELARGEAFALALLPGFSRKVAQVPRA